MEGTQYKLRIILLFSCLFLSSTAIADWIELDTPRFKIISALDEEDTRAWANEFNHYIDSLSLVFEINENRLLPLTLVIFKRNRAYHPYKPLQPNGKVSDNTLGYFLNLENQSMITFSNYHSRKTTRRIIFHETVHWYSKTLEQQLSPWFSEGIAETFSTLIVDNGIKTWGDVIDNHISLLRYNGLMSTSKLMNTTYDNHIFNDERDTSVFYANAWLFTHFQYFGKRDGIKNTTDTYLDFKKERLTHSEFIQAFGMNYEEMDNALEAYLKDGEFEISQTPIINQEIHWPVREAEESTVQLSLARLAIGAGRIDRAQSHIEKLQALSYDPLTIQELNTHLLFNSGQIESAISAATQVIELGSKDSAIYINLAKALTRKHINLNQSPDLRLAPNHARQIANLYNEAISISPNLLSSYTNLSLAIQSLSNLTELDIAQLQQGSQYYPGNISILTGLAVVTQINRQTENAVELLSELKRSNENLNTSELKDIDYYITSWLVDIYDKEVERLIQRNPSDALIKVEQMLEDDRLNLSFKEYFKESIYPQLILSINIEQAKELASQEKNDEAILILQSILNDENSDEFLISEARTLINRYSN